MKIINRKTLMELPEGTIYTEYQPCIFGAPLIKGITLRRKNGEAVDWVQYVFPFETDLCDDDYWATPGARLHTDYESGCRDGFYADNQLYAILERDDVARLIIRLQGCMATAYPPPALSGEAAPEVLQLEAPGKATTQG